MSSSTIREKPIAKHRKLRAGYSTVLAEQVGLDFEKRQLTARTERYDDFLDQHLMWTPSAPVLGTDRRDDAVKAFLAFFSLRNWVETVTSRATQRLVLTLAIILLVALLVAGRRCLRISLDAAHARVGALRGETYANTPLATK